MHAPRDVGEVRGVRPEVDGGARAVEVDEGEVDDGVGGAGRGVGHLRRAAVGVRRVGDPPAAHRRVVDPGDGELRAVGRPPVPAVAVHLLGGDELREPPAHPGAVAVPGTGQDVGRAGRALVDVQRAGADERDAGARRVGPRVDHGPVHRQRLRARAGHQVDGERPARHHEDRQAGRGVEGVLDDPAGLLADPLAARALLRRQVLLAGDVEVARVDEQVLLPGRDVEQPQAGHGVVARTAAQQHHAAPVGRDRGPAGSAEGEPARGGLAAREAGRGIGGGGVGGHAAESACCHPLDARTRSPPPVRLGPWWRRSGARSP